ncbi:hypothetical protein GCM10007352_27750 [Mucilaginibacter phyllosphaerae]|nr:hypothetical protein GCM10007352_27750 [Mucilaginibacter phyllosphaerae]
MAPERESGEIFRNGTAVGIAFELLPVVVVVLCAAATAGKTNNIYTARFLVFKNFIGCNLVLLFKNNKIYNGIVTVFVQVHPKTIKGVNYCNLLRGLYVKISAEVFAFMISYKYKDFIIDFF